MISAHQMTKCWFIYSIIHVSIVYLFFYHLQDSDEEEPPDDSVFNFFNTATVDECAVMPGCSRKKAEAIVALQPFKNWTDLVRIPLDAFHFLSMNEKYHPENEISSKSSWYKLNIHSWTTHNFSPTKRSFVRNDLEVT